MLRFESLRNVDNIDVISKIFMQPSCCRAAVVKDPRPGGERLTFRTRGVAEEVKFTVCLIEQIHDCMNRPIVSAKFSKKSQTQRSSWIILRTQRFRKRGVLWD